MAAAAPWQHLFDGQAATIAAIQLQLDEVRQARNPVQPEREGGTIQDHVVQMTAVDLIAATVKGTLAAARQDRRNPAARDDGAAAAAVARAVTPPPRVWDLEAPERAVNPGTAINVGEDGRALAKVYYADRHLKVDVDGAVVAKNYRENKPPLSAQEIKAKASALIGPIYQNGYMTRKGNIFLKAGADAREAFEEGLLPYNALKRDADPSQDLVPRTRSPSPEPQRREDVEYYEVPATAWVDIDKMKAANGDRPVGRKIDRDIEPAPFAQIKDKPPFLLEVTDPGLDRSLLTRFTRVDINTGDKLRFNKERNEWSKDELYTLERVQNRPGQGRAAGNRGGRGARASRGGR